MNTSIPSIAATDAAPVSRPASEIVVTTVADAENVSPLDLPPLYGAIDPDALDSIVDSMGPSSTESGGSVSFEYAGHEITVAGDGAVSIGESGSDE